jgi:type II secretory pathway predicted ATPase ExeA
MYRAYFGFKEIPFSIAPNPHFLFMGERHKEALAHLTYGLGDTGGFVLLTGEVGTGKTTLSRRLMDQLPENTQAAFILNPTLSSQELLASICDELKIRYRKTGATLKTLSDKIHEKLEKNHQNNINTLLIIDEAQHLKPEVLEQLRLLTNLETHTKKLLQVILIGQPELKHLLQRRDLRQLAQRITARYHLMPLTKTTVADYIKHRLSVVKCDREIFNPSAVAAIYKISGGIPRVVNLLCDRALTNAYCSNNAIIGSKLIYQSAQEALGDEYLVKTWWKNSVVTKLAATITGIVILFGGYTLGQQQVELISTAPTNEAPVLESSLIEAEAETEQTITSNKNNKISNNSNKAASAEVIQSERENTQLQSVVDTNPNSAQPKAIELVSISKEPVALKEQARTKTSSNLMPEKAEPKAVITNQKKESTDFVVSNETGVSDELLAKFQEAISETANNESLNGNLNDNLTLNDEAFDASKLTALADMPINVQNGVPPLAFDMHIYASDGSGWVRVNGRDRYEGDPIDQHLILNKILPQAVVLSYRGEKFTMPALSTW